MSKQKKRKPNKKGNQNATLQKVILVTAILNLLKALIDLVDKLTE